MKRLFAVVVLPLFLGACAGISITPVKLGAGQVAHEVAKKGYIVYTPAVLLPISSVPVCVDMGKDGKCAKQVYECAAGKPILVPDYSKPFTVEVKSGFGKAGAEINVTDGWLLGSLKDNSDNSAAIGSLTELIPALLGTGLKAARPVTPAPEGAAGCKSAGLYQVEMVDGAIVLKRVSISAEGGIQ